ncbi:unnamed protein product [Rangifer tarandus platyrhynchus]|uniref:Protein Wnt n=1 Tax=Rangifer tarandus platyrhynchus TaxID=3082113 RepID=A0ABN8Y0D9_RANTA|nr:unnamed protein product [Rangifer tarandus platyrhynchus]
MSLQGQCACHVWTKSCWHTVSQRPQKRPHQLQLRSKLRLTVICGALQRCSGNNPRPECTVLGRHPFAHLSESCPVADPPCLSAELDELRDVDPVAASLGA